MGRVILSIKKLITKMYSLLINSKARVADKTKMSTLFKNNLWIVNLSLEKNLSLESALLNIYINVKNKNVK